jgi:dGTPase
MSIRQMLEQQEHMILHPRAGFSDESRGRRKQEKPCDVRPIYQHDRDKLIHSKSFRRLLRKTQVFLAPLGDHYRTRMTHTLEVSQIARTLARALRLNEHLTEAIALGHDLGHTPFGHAGEAVLNELMPKGFRHVTQSVRVVQQLEQEGQGLNLTHEVIDGIARHSKGKGDIVSGARNQLPMTLEGQLVRLSDIVAYVNHDLDDALRSGILHIDQLPVHLVKILGDTHSKRIRRMVLDVIKNTDLDAGDNITLSPEIEQALAQMRDFLYETVYDNPVVHDEFSKCRKMFADIFKTFQSHPEKFEELTEQVLPADEEMRRLSICDFVAGMTDRYAIRLYQRLFIPCPWPVDPQH